MKDQKSTFLNACFVIIFLFTLAQANTLIVTTTADSGPGSLRQAMTDANTNLTADTINFNIPQTDAGFNSASGVWTIQPNTDLPIMKNDSTLIDATTQTARQGNFNINGPEIEITGSNILQNGLYFHSSFNKIQGLIISRCTIAGILLRLESAKHNIVTGNYIGTDATGTAASGCNFAIRIDRGSSHNIIGGNHESQRNLLSGNKWGISFAGTNTDSNIVIGNFIGTDISGYTALGNQDGGIYLAESSTGNRIGGSTREERNIISGATNQGSIITGNGITIEASSGNRIIGNYIGTNKDGNSPLPNINYGISINGASDNIIGGLESGEANVISGNGYGGVFIRFPESHNNVISGNFIGTDTSATLALGNFHEGFTLNFGARKNIIGPQNIIVNNGAYGFYIVHDTTQYNMITQNIIANHNDMGIFYNIEASSNIETPPPVIQQVMASYVSGSTFPGWTVEIFSDTLDEASIYEGSVTADDAGNFTWYGSVTGPHVCATATDLNGNTSEFSAPFTTKVKPETRQKPYGFTLQQNYPNPFNPVTAICYDLPNNGHVRLEIFDPTGRKITTLMNQTQKAGSHAITWNSRDASGQPVPSGVYFYRLQANNFSETRKMLLLR